MITHPLRTATALAALATILLGACAVPASVQAWRSTRDYTLPQSAMGAVPCVSDGVTRSFGSTPRRSSHTSAGQYDLNRRGGLGAPEELEVRPADANSSDERVLIGFWTNRPDSTLARIAVIAEPARRAALESSAVAVLEQCGAWTR